MYLRFKEANSSLLEALAVELINTDCLQLRLTIYHCSDKRTPDYKACQWTKKAFHVKHCETKLRYDAQANLISHLFQTDFFSVLKNVFYS